MNSESDARETAEPMRAAFIDHITIRVRNLEASRRFYEAAVAAFGGRAIELDTGEISKRCSHAGERSSPLRSRCSRS